MSIKEDSELRHVLAHILDAIRANAEGHHKQSLYEIDAVEGLVMWDNEEQMTNYIESIDYGLQHEKDKDSKKAQEIKSEN